MPSKKASDIVVAINIHVGQRLRAKRLELNLSQTDLADALGVTFQQVQKYECGANRVSASRLMRAAEFLEVTPSYFFEHARLEIASVHGDRAIADMGAFLAAEDARAVIRAFRKIKNKEMRWGFVELIVEIGMSGEGHSLH